MDKEALKVLREARALISDPDRWTQGTRALDKGGKAVEAQDKAAVCWCAEGAMMKVSGRPLRCAPGLYELRAAAGDLFHTYNIWGVNDQYWHDEVLQMFDRAIKIAEGES